VTGRVSPLILKAALLTEACETVTLLAPGFVRVAVFAALWPTPTFPKDKADGLTAKVPAATAVPDNATRSTPPLAALLVMDSPPAGLPAARGVNVTVMVAL
jgi:hypothetical protein